MLFPDPFDFDGSGDFGFEESAFCDEFLSGGIDDEETESDDWDDED